MLVLSRKVGESLQIHMSDGRVVNVKVTDVDVRFARATRVRIGIDAPEDVVILRQEVPLKEQTK